MTTELREPVLLGVDGGNTKTIAVAAAGDGTILGAGRLLRRSDIYAIEPGEALAIFAEVADRALRNVTPGSAVVAGFSLAGADWPEDHELLERLLGERWPHPIVVNDAIGALRGALPEGPAVVIACGTGAATGARGPDGVTWHTSFWQEAQGGHELGLLAVRAATRSELGIDPPTSMTERLLAATGEPSVEALVHHASARAVVDRRDPASLAWVLLDAADDGDHAAAEIVARQGRELGRTALAAARRVAIDLDAPFGLALTGGVFRHNARALRHAILATVRDGAPNVEVRPPELEPAGGALLLAFDAAGLASGPEVRGRIAAGLASHDLYETHPARIAAAEEATAP